MRTGERVMQNDRGIGMTELAVAILVLGIILVGLFPFVVNSIGLAQRTSDVGQANRIVSSELERARAEFRGVSCASVAGSTDLTPLLSANDQTRFTADRVVTCDGQLATVQVDVERSAESGVVVSTATTKVVTAA